MNHTETLQMPTVGHPSHLSASLRRLAAGALRDFAYLLGVLAMSIAGFTVWVTGVSVTASLLILVVGVAAWIGTVYAMRATVAVDRRLAGWLRREPVPALYARPPGRGWLARAATLTRDAQTWKDLGWLVLNSVAGFALATAALSATAVVISLIVTPLWWWAIPDPHQQYATLNLGLYTVTSTGWAFVNTALGLALAPLALAINRAVASGHAALAAAILRPSERQRLKARARELAASRTDVVEATNQQLERIERDLHDGAHTRLVALAVDLGLAADELPANPDAARAAVRSARGQALSALGELRALSRGLRPALLEERGLTTALEDLAHRSPLPVTVAVAGEIETTPDSVQTAAYFVVAEALSGAARRGEAARVRVSVQRTDVLLEATVADDGPGGAPELGPGLIELQKRVQGLDGRLEVISPPGGPTVVRLQIPC